MCLLNQEETTMKPFLALCFLFFISLATYADTCPQPPHGYLFRVAAWGNHNDDTSQIRCHYYKNSNENIHQEIRTNEYYKVSDMEQLPNWSLTSDRYYLCTSFNTDVNECAFKKRSS